ncbi:DUF1501 domain-containing protein [Armatimonas sp.]|uniref:DUF1501 domain-containing protein n=1 Tax=Armatimonas sp. TaxID=1872638 RepID=UPI00374D1B1D
MSDSLWGLCEESHVGASSRRNLIGGALAAAIVAWSGRSALAQLTVGKTHRKPLITIFLRGAMDGLTALAPIGDDDYFKNRPTIKVSNTLKLDGFFGLHPALGALHSLYLEGKLAPLHAVGSLDQSRSHFEAMAVMERGAASDPATIPSGWVARYLSALPDDNPSPLRGVAFNTIMPDILRGATSAMAINELSDLKLSATPSLRGALEGLYAHGKDAAAVAGREALEVLTVLEKLDPKRYVPGGGAKYPESNLGNGLRQTAMLLKAGVGVETACLDRGGWDTHVGQNTPYLAQQLQDVGDSLGAFTKDLGSQLDDITIVVMTEFGRRVAENSGLGTDHGRASAWFVAGGGVKGGKVYARWPGLKDEQLEAPGDLKVTMDYRDVLTEIVARQLGGDKAAALFPSAPGKLPGLFGPA